MEQSRSTLTGVAKAAKKFEHNELKSSLHDSSPIPITLILGSHPKAYETVNDRSKSGWKVGAQSTSSPTHLAHW